jgi:hypothetical protein
MTSDLIFYHWNTKAHEWLYRFSGLIASKKGDKFFLTIQFTPGESNSHYYIN